MDKVNTLAELQQFLDSPVFIVPEKSDLEPFKEMINPALGLLVIFGSKADREALNASNEKVFERMLEALNKQDKVSDLKIEKMNFWIAEDYPHQHFENDLATTSTQKVLIFGVDMQQFSWKQSLSPYQIATNQNIDYLLVDSLQEIENTPQKKKALWQVLLQFFKS